MFAGDEVTRLLGELGVTHVVWVPDSLLGTWEAALRDAPDLRLLRVCREGEAWPLAAGLIIAGASPLVMMQTTGFFESGDALRNVAFDFQLPVFALVGARNWSNPRSTDSARRFALPILTAWEIDFVLLETEADKPRLAEHYRRCQAARRPGIALLAE